MNFRFKLFMVGKYILCVCVVLRRFTFWWPPSASFVVIDALKKLFTEIRFLFIFSWCLNYDATSVWRTTYTTHLMILVVTYDATIYTVNFALDPTHRAIQVFKICGINFKQGNEN